MGVYLGNVAVDMLGGQAVGTAPASGTPIPTPNMVAEFDDDAKMNSTDMTDSEVDSFFEDITYNPMIVNDTVPIGAIQAYGGEVAPNNWLICDGSAVSRTTYAELFAVIGTTYGTGDGSTTFNLPDLRGNVAIGASEDYELGDSGGEETHTLTINEMPSHTHDSTNVCNSTGTTIATTVAAGGSYGYGYGNTNILGNTGGGQAHNNMQPYIVTNYIIKAKDNEVTGGQLQALTDFFYPIGSYYETSDDTFDPNVSFGGTWELETEGQVHIGAGENYEIGDTGGAETVTLDTTQIPNHRHQYGANIIHSDGTVVSGEALNVGLTNSSSTTIRRRYWDYTEYVGGGQAHNNMQPYIVVNRWHRTA